MTLRRRSFGDEAALETGVDDLLRRFGALTEDPTPPTATLEPVTFAGPVEATFLVAASNARDEIKAVADYVCDGTADQVEINAAWTAIQNLNIGGGRVVLSAGRFTASDKITVNPDQTEPGVMVGAGRGATVIRMAGGSDTSAVRVRAGSTVRDFSILVDGGTVTRGALELDETDSRAYSIDIQTDNGVGVWCDGPRTHVESCRINISDSGTSGIWVHADASESMIVNNVITSARQHGIVIDGDAGGTGEFTQVLGNRIKQVSRQTANTYDGIHLQGPFAADHGPLIVGNTIYKTGGGDFRHGINLAAAFVVDVTVVGNTVGPGVGSFAFNVDGIRSHISGNRAQGGVSVGGDDNHIEGNTLAVINDASNGIVVAGDRNSIFDNKVFPQSGSDPAVGIEVQAGANDTVIGLNDLEQTGTQVTDAGTNTITLGTFNGPDVLTTKGDIHGFDTVDDRIPIGTNGQVLTADSAQGLGLKWDDVGAFQAWSPSYANLTIGNGTVVARYAHVDPDLIVAYFFFTLGSTSAVGTAPTISTPVTASSSYVVVSNWIGGADFLNSGSEDLVGMVRLQSTTTFAPIVLTASGNFMRQADLSATNPFTWTTGDAIMFTAVMEAA